MTIKIFKELLISSVKEKFPNSDITINERRKISIEARINISEEFFIEVYYNILCQKKSFALIKNNKRIFGYDNYRYWHLHSLNKVSDHIQCKEPSLVKVFEEMKNIIEEINK